jgi:hypothetical protein
MPTASELQEAMLNPESKWLPKLAKDHVGMFVSARGLLMNTRDEYMLAELYDHLVELAERYYNGDEIVVDEFLQLYVLGESERKELKRTVR